MTPMHETATQALANLKMELREAAKNYQKDADFHTEKAAEAQAEADKAQAAADAMDVAVNELTSAAAARQETT